MNLIGAVQPTPATTENRLLVALSALEVIADNMIIGIKTVGLINESIALIKAQGFNAIQSGLGNSKPADNEMPYVAFKGVADRKFSSYEGRAKTDIISSFKKSIELGLKTGDVLTDSNPHRAKNGSDSDETKTKTKTGTPTPRPFNAVNVADRLGGKYTVNQIKELITELQKLIDF
jgi:hypothetical protein